MLMANTPSSMPNILIQFGKAVKKIRLQRHLSQGGLAKILGVHPTYISGIERGQRNMTLKNIQKLAQALDVPLNHLIK